MNKIISMVLCFLYRYCATYNVLRATHCTCTVFIMLYYLLVLYYLYCIVCILYYLYQHYFFFLEVIFYILDSSYRTCICHLIWSMSMISSTFNNNDKFIGTGQVPQVCDKQVRRDLSSLFQVSQDSEAKVPNKSVGNYFVPRSKSRSTRLWRTSISGTNRSHQHSTQLWNTILLGNIKNVLVLFNKNAMCSTS